MQDGFILESALQKQLIGSPNQVEAVRANLEKRAPVATGEQGLKVMKILEGIYRSAESGREVRYR